MPYLIKFSQFGSKIYNRLAKQYPKLDVRNLPEGMRFLDETSNDRPNL